MVALAESKVFCEYNIISRYPANSHTTQCIRLKCVLVVNTHMCRAGVGSSTQDQMYV